MQADIGSRCVGCVRELQPNLRTRARFWNAGQQGVVTRILISINALVFMWIIAGGSQGSLMGGTINQRHVDLGLADVFLRQGEWYRMVSAGFLHFGLFHIGMNMLLLYQLGNLLEPILGRGKFTLLYFAALVGGSAGAIISSPNGLTGGASGAVFGLMTATAVVLYQRGINPMQTGLGATLVLNLVITFAIPGISVGGHVGGALVGAAVSWVMVEPNWKRSMPWLSWAAPIVAIVGAFFVANMTL